MTLQSSLVGLIDIPPACTIQNPLNKRFHVSRTYTHTAAMPSPGSVSTLPQQYAFLPRRLPSALFFFSPSAWKPFEKVLANPATQKDIYHEHALTPPLTK